MDKYKVQLSIKAKDDFKLIINYIRYNLLEPNIAKRYSKLIQAEISKLEYSPKRFPVIDVEITNYREIRKLTIKKYIVFYIVDDEEKTVTVDRILGGNMDWQNKI